MVDDILYKHYEKRFEEMVGYIPGLEQAVKAFEKKPHATVSLAARWVS